MALLLEGCQPMGRAKPAPFPESTGVQISKDTPTAPSPSGPRLALTPGGIGNLSTATAFRLRAVQAALPGYRVAKASRSSEGQEYPVIIVTAGGNRLLTLHPGPRQERIHAIVIDQPRAVTGLEHLPGTAFATVYPLSPPEGCQPGIEEWSGGVICPAPGITGLFYRFTGPWNGPDDTLPPSTVLADWPLEQIMLIPAAAK